MGLSYSCCTYETAEDVDDPVKINQYERWNTLPSDTVTKNLGDAAFKKGMYGWYKIVDIKDETDDNKAKEENSNNNSNNNSNSDQQMIEIEMKNRTDEEINLYYDLNNKKTIHRKDEENTEYSIATFALLVDLALCAAVIAAGCARFAFYVSTQREMIVPSIDILQYPFNTQ